MPNLFKRTAIASICPALLAFLVPVRPAGAVESLRLALQDVVQVDAAQPTVRVYFDVGGETGGAAEPVEAGEISATLGGETLELGRLERFDDTGEGVAYVFLLDVSRSLDREQLDGIRSGIGSWIEGLGPADRAAILTFGDDSRVVVDFTADAGKLRAALAGLTPTGDRTLLHRALADALALAGRRDRELPARRVAVVMSDGRDEGSGLAVEDVVALLRGGPMPVYAIGYSKLPEPARSTSLEVLRRFASISGGAFFEADRQPLGAAYRAIEATLHGVWVAEMRCPSCSLDGGVYRLQLNLRRGGRVLSQGADVRLLPAASPAAAAADSTAAEGSTSADAAAGRPAAAASGPAAGGPGRAGERSGEAGGGAADTGGEAGAGGEPAGRGGLAALLALVALLVALVAFLWWRNRDDDDRRPAAEAADPEAGEAAAPRLATTAARGAGRRRRGPVAVEPAVDPVVGVEPPPPRPRRVRLVVLRGSRRGREYAFTLEDSAVVGARSNCQCVLSDEASIAPRQFELALTERQVMVRNLDDSRPTLLNGQPIDGWQPLASNDLLGTGRTVLRVVHH